MLGNSKIGAKFIFSSPMNEQTSDFQRTVRAALQRRGYEDALQNDQLMQRIYEICSKYNIPVEKLLLKQDLLWMNNALTEDTLTVDILDKLDAELQQESRRNSCKENDYGIANFQSRSFVPRQFCSSLDDLFNVNLSNKDTDSKPNGSFRGDINCLEDSANMQLDSPPFSPVRGTIRRQLRDPQRSSDSEFVLEGDLEPLDHSSETRNSGEVLDEYIGTDYENFVQNGCIDRTQHVGLICQSGGNFFYVRSETENPSHIFEQHVEKMCKMMLSKIQKSPQESLQWPASWDFLPMSDEKHLVAGYVRRILKSPSGIQVIVDDTQSHQFHVDVSCIHSCSLFPGAIVVFEGTKCQNGSFQAENVFNISHLRGAKVKSGNDESTPLVEVVTREIQIVVASGPYTISTNLRYDPLKRLLDKVEKMKPDLVILSGPFLDENHRLVENGPTEVTYEDIVAKRVGTLLERCFSKISTKCVIIPHLQDIFHHFTFPQKAFDSSVFFPRKKPDNIFFLDNPAVFRFGHIDIATTSISVLDDLSSVAYVKTPSQKGRITALCEILADEESFYPIFPPAQQRPLDYSNVQQLKLDSNKTKLIIVTSSLKPFTQRLKDDILCVNPGRLSKGVNNGSFAFISHYFKDFSSEELIEEHVNMSKTTSVKIFRN